MAQNPLVSFENNTSQDRKILFKNPTVFNLQGQVLLQQPQQSCDNFQRMPIASFRKLSGECTETSCPAAEAAQGHSGCRLFYFWLISSAIPGLLCKEQTCDTFRGVPHQRRESLAVVQFGRALKDTAHQILKFLSLRNEG